MGCEHGISYWRLFIVVVLGVVVGGLVLDVVKFAAGVGAAKVVLEKVSGDLAVTAQAEQKRVAARTRAAAQARERSPTGRRLSQECEDWERAFDQTGAKVAQQERDKNCRTFREYLETGVVRR